jgi:hypothetical protein
MSTPALGDRVLYCFDAHDAVKLNSWRDNFGRGQAASGHKHPHPPGGSPASGHIAHIGVPVAEGDVAFADVSGAGPEPGRLNLRVCPDGNDVLHVTGVPEGDGPGTWAARPAT